MQNVNYTFDGSDNNDTFNGGNGGTQARIPFEAVQEFQLLTGQFDAEHGAASGAVVNAVSKQGTNAMRPTTSRNASLVYPAAGFVDVLQGVNLGENNYTTNRKLSALDHMKLRPQPWQSPRSKTYRPRRRQHDSRARRAAAASWTATKRQS